MLRVASPGVNTNKTDFPSMNQADSTNGTENFDDILSSKITEPISINDTAKDYGSSRQAEKIVYDNNGTDGNDNTGTYESVQPAENKADTKAAEVQSHFSKKTNENENITENQNTENQNNEDQISCIFQQIMPVITMQTAKEEQNVVSNTDNININGISDAQQLNNDYSNIQAVENSVNQAESSIQDVSYLSVNQAESSVEDILYLNVNQAELSAQDVLYSSVNQEESSAQDISYLNINQTEASAEDISYSNVNQTEKSVFPAEGIKETFTIKENISLQQNGNKTAFLQNDEAKPDLQNNTAQAGTLKTKIQTDEVSAQSFTDNPYNDNAKSNVIIKNNDAVINQAVDTKTEVINTGVNNGMHKMEQILMTAEKNVINYSEQKLAEVTAKGNSTEVNLKDTEQTASVETNSLAYTSVFSGKENAITNAISGDKIVEQVTNSIITIIKSDNPNFTIELSPETLGKITVEMKYANGKLDIKINADSEVTAKVLNEQISQLKSSLTTNNVEFRNIEINNSSHFDFINNQTKGFNQAGGENSGTERGQYSEKEVSDNYTDSRTNENENTTVYYRQNQLLNYLV